MASRCRLHWVRSAGVSCGRSEAAYARSGAKSGAYAADAAADDDEAADDEAVDDDEADAAVDADAAEADMATPLSKSET